MSELSYLCVPRTVPYQYQTIIQVFNEISTLCPNKEILVYRGIDGTRKSLTCHQLQTQATKLAGYLIKKGIKKGDKIALSGPNTLEWVIAELAIIMAGGVAVQVPFDITDARDVHEIASIAECKAFLLDPVRNNEYVDMILQLIAYTKDDSNLSTFAFLRKSKHLTSYDDMPGILQLNETDVEFPTLYPEDDIVVFTTSGSTGKPKMIPKTHFQATNNGMIFSEKTYNDRPFTWLAGCPIFTVYQGYSRIFCDSSVATEGHRTMRIWEVIKEEDCTSALLSPNFLLYLVSHGDNYKNSFKLDTVITTGEMVDNVHTKVVGVFTKSLTVLYGSTETSRISVLPPITTAGEKRVGDVGIPISGIEVKVIDGGGNILRKGESGELCIRSICGFEKYYKDTDLTDEVLLSGKWFRSGDIVCLDKNNHILIKGRVTEFICRGTKKIMPGSIEEVIQKKNGNDLAGGRVIPDPILCEKITSTVAPDEEDNDLYPACAVTRSMTRRKEANDDHVQAPNTAGSSHEIDLSDTFLFDLDDISHENRQSFNNKSPLKTSDDGGPNTQVD
ncbi:medium-chain acyl-CoA ligase ACSF2, mitochondrial-like [Ostrea edulis]|uniref:medium-chain acyl-CoA ligase ACSF2, mitochondrial-like n=1 Tax=Ostrea edulis TaxID=37623 RepID=UPI0024AEA656|nr:medium-chain acyl-CoA ligase ACSF2, mitochondrial-like [Ostrea edulis]